MTTTDAPPVVGSPDDTPIEDGADESPAPTGPLVPVSATAARERERLHLTQGRSGVARFLVLAPSAVRRLGSAEAAENGLRYRPVAWTFIAIVALAFYLPGRAERVAPPQPVAAPSPVVTTPGSTETPTPTTAPPPTPDFTPVAPVPSFTPPAATPTPDPTPTTSPVTTIAPIAEDAPLQIRGWGWATRLPATPLPTDQVAEDTLPVANRLGGVDRVSFLRLTGDRTELALVEHADSAREALGPGQVAICPIVDDDWDEGPEQSFDDAPIWDTETCVGGTETDDRWTFDLSTFDERTGDAGFALVPTVDAPADFQVAFEVGEV